MQQPHTLSISSNFIRSRNRAIEYTDQHHFIQFNGNTISFKPISSSLRHIPGNIDFIILKFQAFLRIYNQKHFQKLKLNFLEWNELDTEALNRIGAEIGKHFKNIKELHVNFFSCPRVTGKGIQHLLSPISRHIKSLRTLGLYVTGSTRITEKGSDHIKSLILKRVKNLRKLSLNFAGDSKRIGDEHFYNEPNVLAHLENQRMALAPRTELYRQDYNYSNSALSLCNHSRYCLGTLQKLVLMFPNQYHDAQIFEAISLVFQNARNLQVLYLGFIDNYLLENDYNASQINYYYRKNITKLRYLTLTFSNYYRFPIFQPRLRKTLSNSLSYLSELRGFTLSFGNAEDMSDENLLEIVNEICLHTKSLESLV